MISARLEQAFDGVEQAAAATLDTAAGLIKQARSLQKAAREGNVGRLKRARTDLDVSLGDLMQAVANTVESWAFADEEEERYLDERYSGEFRSVAAEKGLEIHERDGRLIAPVHRAPTAARPGGDNKRREVSTIRPTYTADLLLKHQKKGSPPNDDKWRCPGGVEECLSSHNPRL